jgi:hypothetical protein
LAWLPVTLAAPLGSGPVPAAVHVSLWHCPQEIVEAAAHVGVVTPLWQRTFVQVVVAPAPVRPAVVAS